MKNIFILLLFISSISYSQEGMDEFIVDKQFSFSAGVNVHQKLQIQTLNGEQQYFSFAYPSPDFGVQYTKHLYGPFSAILGVHMTVDMIGKYWFVPSTDFLDGDKDITSLNAVYYFPLFLNVNVFEKNNFLIKSSVGVKFNYFFPTDLTSTIFIADKVNDTIEHQVFESKLNSIQNQEKTWFPSYCIKLGATYFFKNLNTLTCNLQLNYTPGNIKEGTFAFDYITNPSSGTVQQRNNYIGLEFAYGFGKKRKIKPEKYTLF